MFRRTLFLMTAALLLANGVARGGASPEEKCQSARYRAAAKYALCQQNAQGTFETTRNSTTFGNTLSKCRVKYTDTWAKLQANAALAGSSCTVGRFVDNGTTVTDSLTGLQWEKKTNRDSTPNLADPHDADNTYNWSNAGPGFSSADGTAYTSFLSSLNGACFAGECDWRLPTIIELQTILSEPYPCATSPCIDPIFGPTAVGLYWSSTSVAPGPGGAWDVVFGNGGVGAAEEDGGGLVRAVRGGL